MIDNSGSLFYAFFGDRFVRYFLCFFSLALIYIVGTENIELTSKETIQINRKE